MMFHLLMRMVHQVLLFSCGFCVASVYYYLPTDYSVLLLSIPMFLFRLILELLHYFPFWLLEASEAKRAANRKPPKVIIHMHIPLHGMSSNSLLVEVSYQEGLARKIKRPKSQAKKPMTARAIKTFLTIHLRGGNHDYYKLPLVYVNKVEQAMSLYAEATAYESSDTARLIPLLETTASTFTINEVSADKAYSSCKNLHAIQAVGGTGYIPFKGNARGMGSATTGYDGLWHRMWHFYNFNREAFMQHYHKRSNVETTFSMIKAKFASAVRSKSPTAQVNEVLCKILCHNICVLIQSIYELGIETTFWDNRAELSPARQLQLFC